MKRKQLLENGLAEAQNTAAAVPGVLTKDARFLRKQKQIIEDNLEDAEEALEERLSSIAVIDVATVEVLYLNVVNLKAKLKLYEDFEALVKEE